MATWCPRKMWGTKPELLPALGSFQLWSADGIKNIWRWKIQQHQTPKPMEFSTTKISFPSHDPMDEIPCPRPPRPPHRVDAIARSTQNINQTDSEGRLKRTSSGPFWRTQHEGLDVVWTKSMPSYYEDCGDGGLEGFQAVDVHRTQILSNLITA